MIVLLSFSASCSSAIEQGTKFQAAFIAEVYNCRGFARGCKQFCTREAGWQKNRKTGKALHWGFFFPIGCKSGSLDSGGICLIWFSCSSNWWMTAHGPKDDSPVILWESGEKKNEKNAKNIMKWRRSSFSVILAPQPPSEEVEWTGERGRKMQSVPAFMNHICTSAKCVLYFGWLRRTYDSAPFFAR